MPPISLTHDQLAAVFDAAQPLLPADRDAFLRDVAKALAGKEFGDGVVSRTCREIQHRYFRAPLETDRGPAQLRKIEQR
jgi:hypothetical protein